MPYPPYYPDINNEDDVANVDHHRNFSKHSPYSTRSFPANNISPLPSTSALSLKLSDPERHDNLTRYSISIPTNSLSSRGPSWRSLLPDSVPCRLYILVVILQTIIDLAVEGVLVLKFNQASKISPALRESSARRLPVYFTIFGFAHVFQLFLALDAVWMRNTLQFLFLTFFNIIILIYAIVQIFEIRDAAFQPVLQNADGVLNIPINILTVLTPCVIGIAEILYGILGYSIWLEFGWKVYKLLGADRRIKRMHMHYQILQCLMKFDVFFWGGFSIQLIWMVLQDTNVEYYVTVGALPASVIVLVAGHLGARYENRPLMYAFMLSCIGASGYFAFKLFRIIQQRNLANIRPVFKTLVAFAILAIIFLMATFTWACIVFSNFGAGLKAHMSRTKRHTSPPRGRLQQLNTGRELSSDQTKRLSLE